MVTVYMDIVWVFLSSVKRRFYLNFFPKKTRLLYFLEPIRFGASFAKELGGRRAALGDEQKGARVEVVERVDTVEGGTKGRHGEDGDGQEPLLDFFFKASITDFQCDPPWLSRS
jgi:hypothetical protein